MKSICNKILVAFALLFFTACAVLGAVAKDKEFSEDENRYLTTFEKPTVKSIIQGDYQTKLTDYLTDQVIFRSGFMKIYGLSQKALNKTEYNGVYLCKDDFLIEVFREPHNTGDIIERLNKVAGRVSADCKLMLVPTAVTVYKDKLPSNVSFKTTQTDMLNEYYNKVNMTTIPVYGAIKTGSLKEQMYYRTDHHWTTDAAYIAYTRYCAEEGLQAVPKESFEIREISDDFYGTVYSKALTINQKPDVIRVYNTDMTGISVTAGGEVISLYNEEHLKTKDKYAYFLDGNRPVINISNSKVNNGKKLMVVKDSYANCFIPFLVNHYEEIMVLDTRYYKRGVSKTANEWGATDILFLFNLNTLDTDALVRGIF
ncbi:MAG: DHHW family protein [Clostridiales bacterium]|nr:DHHW family protein [Clostridiales bacterium]